MSADAYRGRSGGKRGTKFVVCAMQYELEQTGRTAYNVPPEKRASGRSDIYRAARRAGVRVRVRSETVQRSGWVKYQAEVSA